MHNLSEHANVIRIKDTYEDHLFVHIVMEPCKGEELSQGPTSPSVASSTTSELLPRCQLPANTATIAASATAPPHRLEASPPATRFLRLADSTAMNAAHKSMDLFTEASVYIWDRELPRPSSLCHHPSAQASRLRGRTLPPTGPCLHSRRPDLRYKRLSITSILSLRSPENAAHTVEAGAGDLAVQAMQYKRLAKPSMPATFSCLNTTSNDTITLKEEGR